MRKYWVSLHDLPPSSLPTLSSRCPTRCGWRDYCDSVCPHPFIPSTQGRLFGCTARQFDYLRGWRHGAESDIFQMLIEKDSCSAVRQKWADKSFPESGRTAHSVIITIIIILQSMWFPRHIPKSSFFNRVLKRNKKQSEQLYLASEIKIVAKASIHPCNWKGTVFTSPLFRRDQMEKKKKPAPTTLISWYIPYVESKGIYYKWVELSFRRRLGSQHQCQYPCDAWFSCIFSAWLKAIEPSSFQHNHNFQSCL